MGPATCGLCKCLLTDCRGPTELRHVVGERLPVPVHSACVAHYPDLALYVPQGDALVAYQALKDPWEPTDHEWVSLRNVEAQRGRWAGSDTADFEAGLNELIVEGWAEERSDGRYRLTATGRHLGESRVR